MLLTKAWSELMLFFTLFIFYLKKTLDSELKRKFFCAIMNSIYIKYITS